MPSIPDINLADLWCFKKYCDQTGYETEWTLVILPRICLISVVIWKATSSVFPLPAAVLIQTSRCSLDVYSSSQLPQLLCNYFVVDVHWYSSWTWQCYTVIFIFMIVHIWLLRHFNHIKSNVKCIKCKPNTRLTQSQPTFQCEQCHIIIPSLTQNINQSLTSEMFPISFKIAGLLKMPSPFRLKQACITEVVNGSELLTRQENFQHL